MYQLQETPSLQSQQYIKKGKATIRLQRVSRWFPFADQCSLIQVFSAISQNSNAILIRNASIATSNAMEETIVQMEVMKNSHCVNQSCE